MPCTLTFDVLLDRFPAAARSRAELAMLAGQTVEVMRLRRAGEPAWYVLLVDEVEIARVAA